MTKEEELFKAAEDGNINKVKSLLNPKLLGIIKPVDVNIAREDGWTLLMAAACKGHRDIVNLLMEKGASVDAKTDDCFTPLMAVIYSELGRPEEAARLEQVAFQTRARPGCSLAPDMAEKVRNTVRQQKNQLLK
jgi:ankyrin repeat protein